MGIGSFTVAFVSALWLAATSSPAAISVTLTDADLARALSIGRHSESERARFHDRYRFVMKDATVERFEVVTEFRRAVMAAEERTTFGDYMFSARQLQERIAPLQGVVSVIAVLRFHPQNTFVFVPEYDLEAGAPGAPLPRLSLARTPVYQTPPPKAKVTGGPIIGASIEAAYEADTLGRPSLPIVLSLEGKTVAWLVIDFGRID